ncbi:MAG: DUF1559 domain-containing protein [Planctomycetes bacterium]|nr:DUF1559 domain-containing protein [Planctomycetota bacterium]
MNNLKQIGLAIQMYHDTFQKLPEATVCDAAGRPLHSWRIFVVPYMFSSPLFSMYRQSEPWNGPNNQKLAFGKPVRWTAKGGASEFSPLTPIYSFRCPCLHEEDSSKCITNYLAVTGAGTAFPDDQRVRMKDITDGTQNTIIVVETVADDINCLEPRDLRIDKMSFKINDNSKPSISSRHPDGPHVLFADCGVYRLNPEIPPVTLKALLTIGGGEAIDRDRLIAEGWLR